MEGATADKLPLFVRVNKEEAAMAQLTAAMVLWFQYGDPVSIHTLAAAAHDCLYWLVRYKGKESILREWMSRVFLEQRKIFIRQLLNVFRELLIALPE